MHGKRRAAATRWRAMPYIGLPAQASGVPSVSGPHAKSNDVAQQRKALRLFKPPFSKGDFFAGDAL
jgi:hypothetical protein